MAEVTVPPRVLRDAIEVLFGLVEVAKLEQDVGELREVAQMRAKIAADRIARPVKGNRSLNDMTRHDALRIMETACREALYRIDPETYEGMRP